MADTQVKSFYKRTLPSDLIPFSSPQGRSVFQAALLEGNMEGYFQLAEQYITQDRPDHCAHSTLVMVLNTLEIDPGKVWIRPWRWYSEGLLSCLADKVGLCLHEFAMVGLCNGLWQQGFYPTGQRSSDRENGVLRCCGGLEEGGNCCVAGLTSVVSECCNPNLNRVKLKYASLETFRWAVKASMRRSGLIVVLNHSRKALSQTGDGHYSPIAGYNEDLDLALVLDVARFKYPPFWCPIPKLYHSLELLDSETGKMRGFLLTVKPNTENYDATLNIDQLSIQRISSEVHSKSLLLTPPDEIFPILIYHFITMSQFIIENENYSQFRIEAENSEFFDQFESSLIGEKMRNFLEEIAEELKSHYLAVILSALENDQIGEKSLFGRFVDALKTQLGINSERLGPNRESKFE